MTDIINKIEKLKQFVIDANINSESRYENIELIDILITQACSNAYTKGFSEGYDKGYDAGHRQGERIIRNIENKE